jgi:hypothetical protein
MADKSETRTPAQPTDAGDGKAAAANVQVPTEALEANPVHFAVRSIYEEFARALPEGAAQRQHYHSVAGDRFHRMAPVASVPDGTYRVAGSDWLLTFKQNRLAAAVMATPQNQYGGRRVIAVP